MNSGTLAARVAECGSATRLTGMGTHTSSVASSQSACQTDGSTSRTWRAGGGSRSGWPISIRTPRMIGRASSAQVRQRTLRRRRKPARLGSVGSSSVRRRFTRPGPGAHVPPPVGVGVLQKRRGRDSVRLRHGVLSSMWMSKAPKGSLLSAVGFVSGDMMQIRPSPFRSTFPPVRGGYCDARTSCQRSGSRRSNWPLPPRRRRRELRVPPRW